MNEQQAIKILKEEKSWESDDRKVDAFIMGIEALEKQIPKKPQNIDGDMEIFDCPCCGHTIIAIDDMTIHQNCLMCGQKLDWSDVE